MTDISFRLALGAPGNRAFYVNRRLSGTRCGGGPRAARAEWFRTVPRYPVITFIGGRGFFNREVEPTTARALPDCARERAYSRVCPPRAPCSSPASARGATAGPTASSHPPTPNPRARHTRSPFRFRVPGSARSEPIRPELPSASRYTEEPKIRPFGASRYRREGNLDRRSYLYSA